MNTIKINLNKTVNGSVTNVSGFVEFVVNTNASSYTASEKLLSRLSLCRFGCHSNGRLRGKGDLASRVERQQGAGQLQLQAINVCNFMKKVTISVNKLLPSGPNGK